MWFLMDECHFSIGQPGVKDAHLSGLCEVEGHANLEDYHNNAKEGTAITHDVKEIIWYYNSEPSHAVKMLHQAGEWGPIAL